MAPNIAIPDPELVRLVLAGALGLFLGLEREWSHRSAGIRTFSLISLLGAVFTVLDRSWLLVLGGVLIVVQGSVLAVQGLLSTEDGFSLTTAVSMLVAYGVGVLVGSGMLLAGVTVAILSSLVLVLKRELHDFAWGLTKAELRSAVEFGVLAFVIYPVLPAGEMTVDLAGLAIQVEPRVVWLLVVSVAAIGIANYAIVRSYGGRGIVVTGFFGGLVSSTAVVGAMIDHVRQHRHAVSYAVAAILLANAAMALRNLAIVMVFADDRSPVFGLVIPLGIVILGSIAVAGLTADWTQRIDLDLDSPFSLRNALGFGALFAVVLVGSAIAKALFGDAGFLIAALLGSLVSSAGATTSAVVLYNGTVIGANTAILAVLGATLVSILVKAALALVGPTRTFGYRVAAWSAALAVLGVGIGLLFVR
ncbi:MgtC/SapB family protein [Halocatena salina]|uniref:MgtC/SapB family protein n=1 Tax=Halocatena salina TaxID=2934340 RepID=A0A8U0A425_9EURY|nr:MgtC/SapB family protein [Halocatena salina]UPM43965.1 MgtC/SapB family protein [Halocatena salina]